MPNGRKQVGYADGKSIWEQDYVVNRGGRGPLPKSNKSSWQSSGFAYQPPGQNYLTGMYGGGISERPGRGAPTYAQKLEKERNKYKTLKSSEQQEQSYMDQSNLDELSGLTYRQVGDFANSIIDTSQGGDGTSWWDTIGDTLGSSGPLGGVKGWLDLGVKGMEAYTGFQQVGLAREQNQLGRDAFTFQKAAWNKDYDARKIAYNTNARDVNAWKAAQTPGGYTMSELVV